MWYEFKRSKAVQLSEATHYKVLGQVGESKLLAARSEAKAFNLLGFCVQDCSDIAADMS